MEYDTIPDSEQSRLTLKSGSPTYGDGDERLFIIDQGEFDGHDEFLAEPMAKLRTLVNLLHRRAFKVGFLVMYALMAITIVMLPVASFTVGMAEALSTAVVRPFARIFGKLTSDCYGQGHSSRFFWYRPYQDYRARFSVLSV